VFLTEGNQHLLSVTSIDILSVPFEKTDSLLSVNMEMNFWGIFGQNYTWGQLRQHSSLEGLARLTTFF